MRLPWKISLAAGAVVVLAVFLRYVEPSPTPQPQPQPQPKPSRLAPVRPLPAPTQPSAGQPDYGPLRTQLQQYISTRSETYSVYFRDLRTGASFGINEDLQMHAASTIKVPIVLYLNTLAASGQVSFDTKIPYHEAAHYQTGAGIMQYEAVEGETYSLRVLTNLSIIISDNIALNMLLDYLGEDRVGGYMRSLGASTVFPGGERMTTAKDMALYIQTLLDFASKHPDLGNRMLDDLAHTIYDIGLSGELPDSVKVAHKEGDITGVADDVGIVYAKRPYIFTVLSSGHADPIAGFAQIAHLSRIAYDYQNKL